MNLAGSRIENSVHVCAFFSSPDEEYAVLGPFFQEGFECGEKAVHLLNPSDYARHVERLGALGMSVTAYQGNGQLELLSWYDTYLAGGYFDPDRMLQAIQATISAAREAGFPRVRLMGHMDWALDGKLASDLLAEYETRVNEVLERSKQPAICVYDLSRMSGQMMMDVLRTHPLTLIGGVLHENPFYTPPEKFLQELRARRTSRSDEHRPS